MMGKGIYGTLTCPDVASPGGRGINPRTKLALVAATAVIALIVVFVGLASLEPKTKPQFVNELPVAAFDYVVSDLVVAFDASASTDPDGTIANYSWSFGDDAAGYGAIVTHTYQQAGTFDVELTVKDDKGATNSTKKSVTVTKSATPAASEPKAVIEIVSKDNLTVVVSGAGSSTSEGAEILSYEWDFGDDTSGTGVQATHTYAANGTYTITLTVADSQGNSHSASVEVTVKKDVPPPPPPPPDEKNGPPGLYRAIEIHESMGDKNQGIQNSLEKLKGNLQDWLEKHGST